MSDICALGIDVGSTTCKIAGVNAKGDLVWHRVEPAEPRMQEQVTRMVAEADDGRPPTADRRPSSADRPTALGIPLVATGYGRGLVTQATRRMTEITCHARGIYRALGHGGTLVDIGGQDSKVIAIGPQGQVVDFAMNDKCAAGTGRFIENTARRLQIELADVGRMALSTEQEAKISSTCTVFAESEIISLIAQGVPVPAILRGLHRSLIQRIVAMIRTVGLTPPLMLSGGVVQNPAICVMLELETGIAVVLPQYPQLMGAYGAALAVLESR